MENTGRHDFILRLTESFDSKGREQQLRILFLLVAVALGLIEVWVFRHNIKDVDGISYLDMGDAYLRGDWMTAINGLWSPLYAWILGLSMLALKTSPYFEYSVIQLVNFSVYVFAVGCFDFFLRELLECQRRRVAAVADHGQAMLPAWTLVAIGYSLFIWSSLFWIFIWLQCPDMCVAAFVYLASGIVLRIRRGAASWFSFVALGAVLGLAFLAKAAMFPLAFTFLFASIFPAGNFCKTVSRVLTALIILLIIASPLIYALSITKGRLTFSDAGQVNYIWHVNGKGSSWAHFPHWQSGIGSGTPTHPARKLFDSPAIYEFGSQVGGTYPMWYDPSYWWEGVVPHFSIKQQIQSLKKEALFYYDFFFSGPQCVMIVGLLIFCFLGSKGWLCVKSIANQWSVLLPAVAAFGMYAIVHVETRYIGAFAVLFWLGLFSGVRLPNDDKSRRWMAFATLAISTVMMIGTAISTARDAMRESIPTFDSVVQWQYAEQLKRLGVQSGEKVGIIGSALGAARWARLARVQIVAETPWTDTGKFWLADEETKARVVDTFATTGVKAIVAEKGPPFFAMNGWVRIGTSSDYAYVFAR